MNTPTMRSSDERLGIPAGTCRRCGFVGRHTDAEDCIAELRDRLGTAELTITGLRGAVLSLKGRRKRRR